MTIRALIHFVEEKPSRWDAPLFVLTQTKDGFSKSRVAKIEVDEEDSDVNFVLNSANVPPKITCLRDIKEVITTPRILDFPIYSRRYFDSPIRVEDSKYTHLDTSLYGVSESSLGSVGLFEQSSQK